MFFKGIIFDLDDTIYDYTKVDKLCLEEIVRYLNINYNISQEDTYNKFFDIRNKLKYEINNSSNRNRFIYFKKLSDFFSLEKKCAIELDNIYWETFYKNISCFEGVIDLIKYLKSQGIIIIILTDFQTEKQYKKLESLNILNLCDFIITSEEVCFEKPSEKMFDRVIKETNLKKEDLIMFGDNFNKDIMGCLNYSIYPFHYNGKDFDNFNLQFSNFNSYTDILKKFKDLEKELDNFVKICNKYGKRFDLVQCGGGNISFKWENVLFIKSSGVHMENMTKNFGYSIIENKKLKEDIENGIFKELTDYSIIKNRKASIETYMHSILKNYTVHLHPILINKLLVRKDNTILEKKFPEALIIDYATPGKNLCKEILKKDYKNKRIFFLLNHGIILTADSYEEIEFLLEDILEKLTEFSTIDMEENSQINICQDIYINKILLTNPELFNKRYCFPDAVVFLEEKYFIDNGKIFIKGKNLKEIREIELILKANLMILEGNDEINFLSEKEVEFLKKWEEEKYRKLLNISMI